MGVYVKYMEMPEGCVTCYLKHDCCDFKQQVSSGNIIKYIDKRLDCCPLIEVTEPHGDLIDRKRIDYKNYKMHDGRGNLIVSDTFVDGVTWVDNCIYDTPAVIEAEGE